MKRPWLALLPPLWHNHNFTRLWWATIISNAGTQITNLALPLTAAMILGATPFDMGLLAMAGSLPNLLFGLFAGLWVDRTQRKTLLIWADVGRALLLSSIPLAALYHVLTFPYVWLVAFCTSTLSIFFTIASVAVLPSVVAPEHLVEANSAFALSDSVITLTGPSAAGGIVTLIGAPKAIFLDSVSYVLSAMLLRSVSLVEQMADRISTMAELWMDIRAGVHALVATPLLWSLTLAGTIGAIGFAMQSAVSLLFLTQTLSIDPLTIGLLASIGGGGSLLSAVAAASIGRVIGLGRAIVVGNACWVLGSIIPALAAPGQWTFIALSSGAIITSLGATLFSIHQQSLRQHLTPVHLLGRVTAARRFLLFSFAPIGALGGGILGSRIGLRSTLLLGGCIAGMSVLFLILSPVWKHNVLLSDKDHASA